MSLRAGSKIIHEDTGPRKPSEVVGLEGHAPDHSFHRFEASDFDGLRRRLEDAERRLAFYAT